MSKDAIIIIVNGEKKPVEKPELSGIEILKLAGYDEPPADIITIQYRDGPDSNPAGSLKPEESVKIKGGMIFDVISDITIIVNLHNKSFSQKSISRDQLVNLAAEDDPDLKKGGTITISYRNGPRINPQGVFEEDETLEVKDGMVFNVSATNRS